MKDESIHVFGDNNNLIGILTESEKPKTDDLCFLLLNAGLLHRVGPYRMSVELAREVASSGIPSFRFDLSGLGDSRRREGNEPDDERAVLDIQDAFDYLGTTKGFKRFVTFGLCSGADNAHATALVDNRLVGAVMLDGPGYPNIQYQVANYGPKVLQAKPWINTIKRLLNPDQEVKDPREIYDRNFGPRERVENEISNLAKRGVELLYIYSGGVEYYYNHAAQFMENFPSLRVNMPGSTIQHEYYGLSDHTYSDLDNRALMFKRVLKWIQEKF